MLPIRNVFNLHTRKTKSRTPKWRFGRCFHMFPFHFGITSSGSLAVRFWGRKVKTVFSGVLDPGIDKKEAKWIMITGMDFERISKSLHIISRVNSKALPSRRPTVRPLKINGWKMKFIFICKPIFMVLC